LREESPRHWAQPRRSLRRAAPSHLSVTIGSLYAKRLSPDDRFAIVVNRCEMRFAMPGQGGDAPGYVHLVDVETGKVLEKTDIDMVNTFLGVEWHPHRVAIPLLVEWQLPVQWDKPALPHSLACEGNESSVP
jgi:hypothetical protein